MNWLLELLDEVAKMVAESAPFLLVGFVLAGLLKSFLPERTVYRQLGGDSLRSVVLAAMYGVPLPLCSCSVVPMAASLKESGASKGATASFLISTPETGVDSISVTYALLDPVMAVIRPVVAFVTAIATGSWVNWMVRTGRDEADLAAPGTADCGHEGDVAGMREAGSEASAACCDDPAPVPARTWPQRAWDGVRYAFGPLLDDLTPWFILGFLLSGVIAVLLPDKLFEEVVPAGWLSMLLMLALGTPVYICAVASTPVAAALIAKGLDPGAALVFLLAGPATNATTVLIVHRMLGKRVLWIYLTCIAGFSLLAGFLVNRFYEASETDLSKVVASHLEEAPGPVGVVTGVALTLLLVWSAVRLRLLRRSWRRFRGWFGAA